MDNLYYSSVRRRPKKRGLFTPFLIILCVIVILVLIVQIFASLRMQSTETKRNQAFIYIERGTIQFQPWGEDVWHDAYNQALIWEGDRIRTSKDSYAVLEFYDGSRLRINEDTEFLVEKVDAGSKAIDVELRLAAGEIWVNELNTDENLNFRVFTKHMDIAAVGTRYAVSMVDNEEFVRVLDGEVKSMLYDNLSEDPELLDSVSIGIGQQIDLNDGHIEALQARKYVNLLAPIDDYWKVTEWYLWNVREDENPSLYTNGTETKQAEGQRDTAINGAVDISATDIEADTTTQETAPVLSIVPAPKLAVTNPPVNPYELKEQRIYLKGTVSSDVTKVIVTEFYDDPKGVPYQLSKFVPGSGVWNYAAGLDFGNIKPGKNRFVVQAYNGEGLISDPVEIFINVAEATEIDNSATIETVPTVESPTTVEPAPVVEAPAIVEPSVETGKKISTTKPLIVSFEDAEKTSDNYFVTTADRVVINGSTGGATDAIKLFVNGWPLSLYEAGSTHWTYYAKAAIGTLKRGVNVYNVYSENAAGERSLSLTFTIEKQ